jgi:glucose-6-phosphate isomerase
VLTSSAVWQRLQLHYIDSKSIQIKTLFAEDPKRFKNYSLEASGITLDYSKNHIMEQTKSLLLELAVQSKVEQKRDDMFSGVPINLTENRAVLHTALRDFSESEILIDNINIKSEIKATLLRIKTFVDSVSNGDKKGYSDKAITDVVSIGIGGSFLGPKIMSEALKPYRQENINVHFVANVDGCHIHDVLKGLVQETTLIITSSKTLSTQETLQNTETARAWFLQAANKEDIKHNFACVTSNIEKAKAFGINEESIFPMWDWVGGRYSVWSAIGLTLALAIGYDNYEDFLRGAYEMDCHFKKAPLSENMPVLLALLGIWYRNFHGAQSQVILPYYHYLRGLPAYIQQLDMESNGKSVTINNDEADYDTGPIIWGSEGTNGQHSFHQLIHQSKTPVPVDFIFPLQPAHAIENHHDMLAANCFGQSKALMQGQSEQEVVDAMKKAKSSPEEINKLTSHKVMKGNKPSNTLLVKKLDPKSLGSLIALYEHKVFVQGVIWQVNSFDQWGVELGKSLGKQVLKSIIDTNNSPLMDGSTDGLVRLYKQGKI